MEMFIGGVIRHVKTGRQYMLVDLVRNSTNGHESDEKLALYHPVGKSRDLFVRDLQEFMDGRFEPLPEVRVDDDEPVRSQKTVGADPF